MRLLSIFTFLLFISASAQKNIQYVADHKDEIKTIKYSPDGSFIVSGGWDRLVQIHKSDSTSALVQIVDDHRGAVNTIAFSRDNRTMITGGQDAKINIYIFDSTYFDVATSDTSLVLNEFEINRLIYGPGMRTIFSAGDDGQFITYDLVRQKAIPLKGQRPISAAAVSIDRRSYYIAYEGDAIIYRFDVRGKEINRLEGHSNDITDILVTVDRKSVISSSKDKSVRIWETKTGKEKHSWTDHTWAVTDIDIDPFATFLVSGSLDGTIILYDLKKMEMIDSTHFKNTKINAVALSPDYSQMSAATNKVGDEGFGYYVIQTDIKPRKIVLPEPMDLAPLREKYQQKEQAKIDAQEAAKRKRQEAKKASEESKQTKSSPASSKKTIKHGKQVEITINDNE